MKRNILLQVLCFTIFSVSAQQRPVYAVRPLTETERIKKESIREWQIPQGKSLSTNPLPAGIDNSLLNYFPPIFNQRGNSCSQASGVRYAFTYEINRLLDREGKTPDHIFSYHFSWNYLNNGKDEGSHPELGYDILKASGAATQTDMNDESAATSATTWMNGYDKYLRAMKYRVKEYAQFTLKTPEGIARLKQFLYNRGEEGSAGGVVTFSCKSSDWRTEPYKGESATGLETILTRIGTDGAHALTIVGYDDKVEFDLDRNGSITDDEKGAFIIANSWGTWWASQGKCYYPYKFFLLPAHEGGLADLDAEALMVEPEIHEPQVVFKIKLTYTSRNDLFFRLGVAEGQGAQSPSVSFIYPLMLNQGGDYYMHGEGTLEEFKTIEVGLDFTDMLPGFNSFKDPKFFLTVRKIGIGKSGEGAINRFSVIDYRTDTEYICNQNEVILKGETILSTALETDRGISTNETEWMQSNETTPVATPFILKTADGTQAKIQFQEYDSTNGKVTIRYQPLQ